MPESVTGFNAERSKAVEDRSVVSYTIDENNRLILTTFAGDDLDAGEVPPEPPQPTYKKIAEVELGAAAATIDFSGIPNTYKHLKIFGSVKGDGAAAFLQLLLRVNNATTAASYYAQAFQGNAAVAGASEALAAGGSQFMAWMPGGSASAGSMCLFEMTICDYEDGAKYKPIFISSVASWGGATGNLVAKQTCIVWNSQAAINRLTFLANSGNLVAGSQISVYGIESAFWVSQAKRYFFDGQSLGYSPFVTEQAYPYKFMQLLRPNHRHHVCNLPGTTYAERAPSLAGRLDRHFGTTPKAVLFDDGGTYDLEAGHGNMSSAALLAAKTAYTAARRAAGADVIVGMTIPPTVLLTAAEETNRLAVNAALVADPATYGYDQVVNLDAIPQLQDENNTAYYYDGTHYTDAATTLVAQALAATGV